MMRTSVRGYAGPPPLSMKTIHDRTLLVCQLYDKIDSEKASARRVTVDGGLAEFCAAGSFVRTTANPPSIPLASLVAHALRLVHVAGDDRLALHQRSRPRLARSRRTHHGVRGRIR